MPRNMLLLHEAASQVGINIEKYWQPMFAGPGLSADLCSNYDILTDGGRDLSVYLLLIHNYCTLVNDTEHQCISGAKIKGG